MGPFTEKDDEEAYGKAAPLLGQESLREGWALTGSQGRSLREGPVPYGKGGSLTGSSTGRQGPYGKPLTGRNGPYGKARSLQEGPGASFIEKDDETYRLYGALFGCPYGNDVPTLQEILTGRPPYGKPYGEKRS